MMETDEKILAMRNELRENGVIKWVKKEEKRGGLIL